MKITEIADILLEYTYKNCNENLHCEFKPNDVLKLKEVEMKNIQKAHHYLQGTNLVQHSLTSCIPVSNELEIKISLSSYGVDRAEQILHAFI